MVDGGKQPIQTLYIDDLAKAIEKGILNDISGVYPMAEPHPITMKNLYKQICKKENKNPMLISIPFCIANAGVFIFNLLGLNSPVSKENLLGLKWSRTYDISRTVKSFEMDFIPLEETLKIILY